MDSSIYEVYALRYAMHEGRKASENFLSHDDQHSGLNRPGFPGGSNS